MQKQVHVFSKLVKVLMESTNERLDAANNNWHELKSSLQLSQHETDILKTTYTKLTDDSECLEKKPESGLWQF